MSKSSKQRLLFIKDVSQILNVKPITLRRWWTRGVLPKPSLLSGRWCWRIEVIEKFITDHTDGLPEI